MSIRLSTSADYANLLGKYDTWMFDCDGVLWERDKLIDGAAEALNLLRRTKKKVIFVTNNSIQSRKTIKAKFDRMGVEVHVDEIYGSAYVSAVYLSSVVKLPKDKKVYVIGESGIEEELLEEGVAFIGGTDPADCTFTPFALDTFTPDPDVSVVLCGLDRSINYTKLCKAFQYLLQPSCLFLATNGDRNTRVSGTLLPAAGAMSSPLIFGLDKHPITLGKPATTMMDCIKAKVHFDLETTIMVGDQLDTDILFGQNSGLSTLLVLTGVMTNEDITSDNPSPIVPDYVTQSIGDLRKAE